jgi:hypothetical protein
MEQAGWLTDHILRIWEPERRKWFSIEGGTRLERRAHVDPDAGFKSRLSCRFAKESRLSVLCGTAFSASSRQRGWDTKFKPGGLFGERSPPLLNRLYFWEIQDSIVPSLDIFFQAVLK